jgi:hypothetical protein
MVSTRLGETREGAGHQSSSSSYSIYTLCDVTHIKDNAGLLETDRYGHCLIDVFFDIFSNDIVRGNSTDGGTTGAT